MTQWGGDYELLFTFDKTGIQSLYDLGVGFLVIGTVTDGCGAYLNADGERRVFGDAVYQS